MHFQEVQGLVARAYKDAEKLLLENKEKLSVVSSYSTSFGSRMENTVTNSNII